MKIFFPFSGFSVGGSHISILNIIQNLDEKFVKIVNSPEWKELQQKFNKCDFVVFVGDEIYSNNY